MKEYEYPLDENSLVFDVGRLSGKDYPKHTH
jgi:hypothetical protein